MSPGLQTSDFFLQPELLFLDLGFFELFRLGEEVAGRKFVQPFVEFETWERRSDGTTVIRLMASWATPESDIEAFTAVLAHVLAEDQDR